MMRRPYAQRVGVAFVSFLVGCSLNPQPLPPDAPNDAGTSSFATGGYDAGNSQTTGSGVASPDAETTVGLPTTGDDAGARGAADGATFTNGSADGGPDGGPKGGAAADAGPDGARGDASDAGDAPLAEAGASDALPPDASGDAERVDSSL